MPRPRKDLICETDTTYYHCFSRCVRRAFLCGYDSYSGTNYEHRRAWVEDRIHLLAEVFAIDVCAYAVMSNHIHLVLHINSPSANNWSLDETIERWHRLYKGTLLSQEYIAGNSQIRDKSGVKMQTLKATAAVWRRRLSDISWFMRALNEPIARQANKEDGCTGKFWEARFKSQALLDEKAVERCMAYVDLNPIRAGLAETLDTSDHTSIKHRLKLNNTKTPSKYLMEFKEPTFSQKSSTYLPFTFDDYHRFLISVGGVENTEKVMIDFEWSDYIVVFSTGVTAVGSIDSLEHYKQKKGLKRVNGGSLCKA